MAEGVIPHEEVLHHIYAFLRAYGYKNSLLALQNESRVPYNIIDVVEPNEDNTQSKTSISSVSPAGLELAVLEGKWDVVLETYVDGLLLPEEVMFDLYEHVFEELLTLHGFIHAARAFFYNSPIFLTMRRSSAARYARLQQLLDSHKSDTLDNLGSGRNGPIPSHIKEKREMLLKVLQEAITWNTQPYNGTLPAALWKLQNSSFITSSGEQSNGNMRESLKRRRTDNNDNDSNNEIDTGVLMPRPPSALFLHYPLQCPKKIRVKISFADAAMPASCAVTTLPLVDANTNNNNNNNNNNNYTALIVGRTDGVVDFVNGDSGLPVGSSVGHTDGVLSLTLDTTKDENGFAWVAVGYRDGWVKIYNTETRKLVRRFTQVHNSGVTSLVFAGPRCASLAGHCSFVVSGSFDGAIQLLDIREGKSLRRISDAHQLKYVLSLCVIPSITEGEEVVVSAGNNGTLCFWSLLNGDLEQIGPARSLHSIHASLREEIPTRLLTVNDTIATGEFVVLTRGKSVLVLRAHVTGDAAHPVIISMHCTIVAPRMLYGGCLRVIHTPALGVPLLSVFLTDREGTILLYNVEMSWRSTSEESGSGSLAEMRPTDESSIIAVEHGKIVEDLNVVNVIGQSTSLLAYSPSLSTMYVLSWD